MAAPPPNPVEPIFSRSLSAAAIAFAVSPVLRAAAVASCWNSAFLLATARFASTLSTSRISESSLIAPPREASRASVRTRFGNEAAGAPPALRLSALASSIDGAFGDLERLAGRQSVVVLPLAVVAAQLLLDLVGRRVERGAGIGGAVGRLEDQALGRIGDDFAGEAMVVRALAEGHLRRDDSGAVFARDRAEPCRHALAQGLAGFELVTRDPDVHEALQFIGARCGVAG